MQSDIDFYVSKIKAISTHAHVKHATATFI